MIGLHWSNKIQFQDNKIVDNGLYVFVPQSPQEPFVLISKKMSQLNDYCLNTILASKAKLAEVNREATQMVDNNFNNPFVVEDTSDEVDKWDQIVDLYSQSVPIVLLMCFLEWSLKLILKEYTGVVPKKPKNARLSDVDFYIQQICNYENHTFKIDSTIIEKISMFREIRNHFAHGEWNKVKSILAITGLRDGFSAVTKLLNKIESEIRYRLN